MKRSKNLIFLCLLFSWSSYAQDIILNQLNKIESKDDYENPERTLNNQIKINLATLFWQTGSLNYERQISNRWTLGITANYRPNGSAPFKSQIQKIFGESNETYLDNKFDVNQLDYGNWSLSPEVKFYLGKSGAFKGFYIAGFVKYENIDLDYDLPLEFDIQGYNIQSILPLSGSITPWSGGIYFGNQWQLGKNWYIDWQIIGGNFGGGNMEVSAHQNLSDEHQEKIRSFAEEIQDQLSNLEYEVNSKGARIWGNIPWAGLRMGLSIGFAF